MNIIQFPIESEWPGFRRARGKANWNPDQLSLFLVFRAPVEGRDPFQRALELDAAGEDEEAEALYHRAIEAEDHLSDAYCNLGLIAQSKGKPAEALHFLSQSVLEDPSSFHGHYNLGLLYLREGSYRPAQLHFEYCSSLEPHVESVHYCLAITMAYLQEYKSAAEALERYRSLVPEEEGKKVEPLLTSIRQGSHG